MIKKIIFSSILLGILCQSSYGVNALMMRMARVLKNAHVKKASYILKPARSSAQAAQKTFVQSAKKSSLSPKTSSLYNLKSIYKFPSWPQSVLKSQLRKTFIASSAVAAATINKDQSKAIDTFIMPDFTAANIDRFRGDRECRKAFIEHAAKHIVTADPTMIETMARLLEQYREAGPILMASALEQCNAVQPRMFKYLIQFSPDDSPELIKTLLNKPNNHLEKVIKQSFEPSHIQQRTWQKTTTPYGWIWEVITEKIPNPKYNPDYLWTRESFGFKQLFATHLLDTLIENPGITSVNGYNTVYDICESIPFKDRKYLLKRLSKGAIYHYGQDAATMIDLAKGLIKYENIKHKPQCVYAEENGILMKPSVEHVVDAVIRDLKSVSVEDMEWTYNYIKERCPYTREKKKNSIGL